MEERRKNKRMQLQSKLLIKRLDSEELSEADIEIEDVSKQGVGFSCKEALSIGAVYESYITLWTREVLHAFIQIVRIELKNNLYYYGSIFIGMSETDAARIEVYRTVSEYENE